MVEARRPRPVLRLVVHSPLAPHLDGSVCGEGDGKGTREYPQVAMGLIQGARVYVAEVEIFLPAGAVATERSRGSAQV